MKTHELLEYGKSLIDTPEKWCKIYVALSSSGSILPYDNINKLKLRNYESYCSYGAFRKACYDNSVDTTSPQYLIASDYLDDSAQSTNIFHGIIEFNDHEDTTHKDVMMVWNKAIKYAKK